MRKRVVLAVAVAAAILAAAYLLWPRGTSPTSERGDRAASGSDVHTSVYGQGREARPTQRVAKLPSGFADAGARERRIAGRVMFAGKPFAGATVRLSAWGGMLVPPDGERTSAQDGTFDFGLRAPGWYEAVATAPKLLAAIVRVQAANPNAKPAPDALELVLEACETRVVGFVRDAVGGPIVSAQIRRDGVAGVETDEKGAYELCVPPGEVNVDYSADGYGAVHLTFDADQRTRRDVVLVPEAVVQGIVVDEEDKPVADAYIVANPSEWGPERAAQRSTLSGPDGRFRIAQVMPGRVRIWGFAEGLATQDTQEVVAEVGTSPDVIVRLVARSSIAGRVMRGKEPIAGAEIVAVRKSPAGRSWNAYTQADGSFVLSRVPPGDVVLSMTSYRVKSPTEIHIDAKPLTGVIVEVEQMASIKGRVTRNGKPVEGTKVCCIQRPNGREVLSDASGDYAFEGVEPGSYQLFAQNDRVGAFTFQKDPVVVAAGEEKRLDFDLVYAATITGTVVDEAGAPLGSVAVRFKNPTDEDSCRGVTDERGHYRCPSMTGGAKYTAVVFSATANGTPMETPPGKPYPVIDVKDGSSLIENVTITVVHHRGEIRGRVVDTTGKPVADAQVKANTEERFNSWVALPTTVTDADGAFVLRDLTDGAYSIQARAVDGGTGTTSKVPINGAPVSIVVTRPGSIEGNLVGFPAPPVVYAVPVTPFAEQTSGVVTGTTYRVGGLKPGRYIVNFQTTFEGDIHDVEIRAAETVKLDVTSRGRATIEATVNDYATKAPVAGIQCHVVMASRGIQGLTNWDLATAARSDASGRLRFDPAPAGNVIVTCLAADGRRSQPSAEVEVRAGATAKVQLWSVETKASSWSYTGLAFDWRVVPPRIALVVPKSPASNAGLLAGDLVVAVDDKPVGVLDASGVLYLLVSYPVGTKVPITVTRGTQKLRVVVEMGTQP